MSEALLHLATVVTSLTRELGLVISSDALASMWLSMERYDADAWLSLATAILSGQSLCEEHGPIPRPEVSTMMYWERSGGSLADFVKQYLGEVPGYAGFSWGELWSTRDFMRACMLYVYNLYRIIEPSGKLGNLVRLGFYTVRYLSEYFEGSRDLADLLATLASVALKNLSPNTILRPAIFVFPWLKLWIVEAFLTRYCHEYSASLYHMSLEGLYIALRILAFLDLVSLDVAYRYGPQVYGIVDGARRALTYLCAFWRQAGALNKLVHGMRACLEPAIRMVCEALYALEARRSPAFAATMHRYCEQLWNTLFRDFDTFLTFMIMYYTARSPWHLRRAYEFLAEASGVPYYAVRRIFWVARALGQWGYPEYLGGGL